MSTRPPIRGGLVLCTIALGMASASYGQPIATDAAVAEIVPLAFPTIDLSNTKSSTSMEESLGPDFYALARYYNRTPEQFRQQLRDPTIRMTNNGRLYYVDPPAPPPTAKQMSRAALGLAEAPPFPLNQTFLLNSRPGADRTIFLDFDGHRIENTWWNFDGDNNPIAAWDAPPWNLPGDADRSTNFTDLEKETIQRIWQIAAEDFMPFNINVTTQDPGQDALIRTSAGDQQYGQRALMTVIGASRTPPICDAQCGGVAFLGTFNAVFPSYFDRGQPAFVFNEGEVGAGLTISHEVGHNFNLGHDGDGINPDYYAGHGANGAATSWGPIMGAPFSKELWHWSKGEYPGANNQQDDFTVIQQYGGTLITDDHSQTSAGATPATVTPAGATSDLSASGLINQASDADWFTFDASAGPATFTATPGPHHPNLDIEIRLYTSSLQQLAISNPPDTLNGALAVTLAATGQYFLRIDGVGKTSTAGNPGYSDYGSLGPYTISGTVVAGVAPPPPPPPEPVDPGILFLLINSDSE